MSNSPRLGKSSKYTRRSKSPKKSHKKTRSKSRSKSPSSKINIHTVGINIIGGDFNRIIEEESDILDNNAYCSSTVYSDYIIASGKLNSIVEQSTECFSIQKTITHTRHYTQANLETQYKKLVNNKYYNKSIHINCSDHRPLFSRLIINTADSNSVSLGVLNWNIMTQGAHNTWNNPHAVNVQVEDVCNMLGMFMSINSNTLHNIDIICLQEFNRPGHNPNPYNINNLSNFFKSNNLPIQILKLEHILQTNIPKLTDNQQKNTWILLSITNTKQQWNAGNAILVRLNIINIDYLKKLTTQKNKDMRSDLEKDIPDSISSTSILLTKKQGNNVFNIHSNIFCLHDIYALKNKSKQKDTEDSRRVEEQDIIMMLNS